MGFGIHNNDKMTFSSQAPSHRLSVWDTSRKRTQSNKRDPIGSWSFTYDVILPSPCSISFLSLLFSFLCLILLLTNKTCPPAFTPLLPSLFGSLRSMEASLLILYVCLFLPADFLPQPSSHEQEISKVEVPWSNALVSLDSKRSLVSVLLWVIKSFLLQMSVSSLTQTRWNATTIFKQLGWLYFSGRR